MGAGNDQGIIRLGVVGAGNIAELNVAGYLEHPRCDVARRVRRRTIDRGARGGRRVGRPRRLRRPRRPARRRRHRRRRDPHADPPAPRPRARRARGRQARVGARSRWPTRSAMHGPSNGRRAPSAGGRTLRISECFFHYPPLELAKQLVRDGAIGRPTGVRIKTVVGQTDSAFQANLRPEGYVWRLDDRSPGGHLFDDMVHKYAMASWLVDQDIVSVQAVVRRRDLFFEPCAAIFEYEDPALLGIMDVTTHRGCGCARATTAPTSSSRCRATRASSGSPGARARCSTSPRWSSTGARTTP